MADQQAQDPVFQIQRVYLKEAVARAAQFARDPAGAGAAHRRHPAGRGRPAVAEGIFEMCVTATVHHQDPATRRCSWSKPSRPASSRSATCRRSRWARSWASPARRSSTPTCAATWPTSSQRAGFPPVHLAEINFQAMYEQQQAQAGAGRAVAHPARSSRRPDAMKLLVLGAGAWGTALAANAAGRHEVTLWARDAAQAACCASARKHPLSARHSLARIAARRGRRLAGRWPAQRPGRHRHADGGAARHAAGAAPARAPVAWLCKGFEPALGGGLLGHEIQAQVAPGPCRRACSPAPASRSKSPAGSPRRWWRPAPCAVRDALVAAFHGPALRIYANDDLSAPKSVAR
jgi:hypothetical protein